MFTLLLLRKLISTPALKIMPVIMSLIAMFLMIFLSLACNRASGAFSGIFLIETITDSSFTRAGYFHLCESGGSSNSSSVVSSLNNTTSASMICASLSKFDHSLAYNFAKHVVRPYFVVISAVLTALTFVASIANAVLSQNPVVNKVSLATTTITLCFSIVTACWQEVAVHAATVLVSSDVKRGHRAASMVWSAVAMLVLCTIAEVCFSRFAKSNDVDTESTAYPPSTDTSFISNPFIMEKTEIRP